jgi:hypothetical protein
VRESSGDAGVLRRSDRSVLEASTGEAAVEHAKKSRAGLRVSASPLPGKARQRFAVTGIEFRLPSPSGSSGSRRLRPLKTLRFQLSDEGMANLPVKAERVNQASQSPAMLLAYRENLRRASGQRPRENCVRVTDGQDHADRPAPKRLRA